MSTKSKSKSKQKKAPASPERAHKSLKVVQIASPAPKSPDTKSGIDATGGFYAMIQFGTICMMYIEFYTIGRDDSRGGRLPMDVTRAIYDASVNALSQFAATYQRKCYQDINTPPGYTGPTEDGLCHYIQCRFPSVEARPMFMNKPKAEHTVSRNGACHWMLHTFEGPEVFAKLINSIEGLIGFQLEDKTNATPMLNPAFKDSDVRDFFEAVCASVPKNQDDDAPSTDPNFNVCFNPHVEQEWTAFLTLMQDQPFHHGVFSATEVGVKGENWAADTRPSLLEHSALAFAGKFAQGFVTDASDGAGAGAGAGRSLFGVAPK